MWSKYVLSRSVQYRRLFLNSNRLYNVRLIHHEIGRPQNLIFATPRRLLSNEPPRTEQVGKLRQLTREYGRSAIAIYLLMSATSFSMIFIAIWNGIDVEKYLQHARHLISDRVPSRDSPTLENSKEASGVKNQTQEPQEEDEETEFERNEQNMRQLEKRGWSKERFWTTFLVAFGANKLLSPIKLMLTGIFTPSLVKWWRKLGTRGR